MIYFLFAEQLRSLQSLLQNLTEEHYVRKSALLGGASIGQHIRHTIELAQSLTQGYETGLVNYDNRKRDQQIETDLLVAEKILKELLYQTELPNKALQVIITNNNSGEETTVDSNYYRELAYNLEHAVHHMALMRVALREMQLDIVPDYFGVAPSTVKFKSSQQSENLQI